MIVMMVRDEYRSNVANIDTSPSKTTCNTVARINNVMLTVYG